MPVEVTGTRTFDTISIAASIALSDSGPAPNIGVTHDDDNTAPAIGVTLSHRY
jgi:hypothetical protein